MKILEYNSCTFGSSQYNMFPTELYNKFDIKTIYLAYHDADSFAIWNVGGIANMGMSGYVQDSISFYYFILERNNKPELRLTFDLSSDSWNLNDVLDSSEKMKKLDKQNAINLIEFIDLFGI